MTTRTATVLLALTLVATLLGGAVSAPRSAAMAGRPAPQFRLNDLNGKSVSLASLRGNVVVLDFWATWCGPCVRGLPVVDATIAARRRQGVKFYAINVAEPNDRVSKFVRTRGWNFGVLMDRNRAVSKNFGVGGIPHLVVIDRNGVVSATHAGFQGDDSLHNWLDHAIQDALRR